MGYEGDIFPSMVQVLWHMSFFLNSHFSLCAGNSGPLHEKCKKGDSVLLGGGESTLIGNI